MKKESCIVFASRTVRLSCCTPLRAQDVIKSHMTKTLYGVCVLRRMAENVHTPADLIKRDEVVWRYLAL